MDRDGLLASCGPGEASEFHSLARELLGQGEKELAATALDRAYGLAPDEAEIVEERSRLLDELAVERCGVRFRYVPAGTFLMGSEFGEADERPLHEIQLDGFWMMETPVSWDQANFFLGWGAPADFRKRGGAWCKERGFTHINFLLGEQIRLQYCEDHTEGARDWHAHIPPVSGKSMSSLFGSPSRSSRSPYSYSEKPIVGSSHMLAVNVGVDASKWGMECRLPTEAEWEKAARGGLVNRSYPWGNDRAGTHNCDCNRFEQFVIQRSRSYSPNGYGLYATSGGVCEWTGDWYDAEYYSSSPGVAPTGPETGIEKVLRGGSWADCPEVATNSYRMSLPPSTLTPNAGFRLCVTEFRDIPEGKIEPDGESYFSHQGRPGWLRDIFGRFFP